jgi:Hemopexin
LRHRYASVKAPFAYINGRYPGKCYFFKGDQYIRYDVNCDRADEGYPRLISATWGAVYPDNIDAAVVLTNGKGYFFQGSQYIRYDMSTDRVDPGYPKLISEGWHGVFSEHIDSVVRWNNGKL